MTVLQTKRVRYVANERLDLNDKLAEDTLRDAAAGEGRKTTVIGEVDGRVFSGFTTSVGLGAAPADFTFDSADSVLIDRNGRLVTVPAATLAALAGTLVNNTINYISIYGIDTASDNDTRRVYQLGTGEVDQAVDTRYTRDVGIDVHTEALPGPPSYGDFPPTTVVGSETVQLIPMFALVVDTGSITDIDDFRPMFAPESTNEYETAVPDFPHDFSPTDAPTLGITDIRTALVALADRIKDIKGTTNWWDDSPGFTTPPGGSDTWVQFNDAGTFGASPDLTWDGSVLTVVGDVEANSLQAIREDPTAGFLAAHHYSDGNTTGPSFQFWTDRGTLSPRVPATVLDDDLLGKIEWQAHEGSDWAQAALIEAYVDGTPGANDMPTRLEFSTTPNGSDVSSTALTIYQSGNVTVRRDKDAVNGVAVLNLNPGGTSASASIWVRSDAAYMEMSAYSSAFSAGTLAGESLLGAIRVSDASSAALEASKFMLGIVGSGPLHLFTGNVIGLTIDKDQITTIKSAIGPPLYAERTAASDATLQTSLVIARDAGNSQVSDGVSADWQITSSTGIDRIVGQISAELTDATNSSEDADFVWGLMVNGASVAEKLRLTNAGNLIPQGLIQFIGTTSSYPALKRVSTGLQVRLADDSTYAPLTAHDIAAQGDLTTQGDLAVSNKLVNGQYTSVLSSSIKVSGLSGASVDVASFIPVGATVVAFSTRVTALITGIGVTGWDVGLKTVDTDKFGTGLGLSAGTTSDNTDWTDGTIACFPVGQTVTVTALGGTFSGGDVRLTVHYIACSAATS